MKYIIILNCGQKDLILCRVMASTNGKLMEDWIEEIWNLEDWITKCKLRKLKWKVVKLRRWILPFGFNVLLSFSIS